MKQFWIKHTLAGLLTLVIGLPGHAVKLKKALLFNHYTLDDTTRVGKRFHVLQWNQISEKLDSLAYFQQKHVVFGILQNYKNKQGLPPLVRDAQPDAYRSTRDPWGVSRHQAIPLYSQERARLPERYGRDGTIVAIVQDGPPWISVRSLAFPGVWLVPRKYVKQLDTATFHKVIFVDRTNQNIATLEYADSLWLIRSINPATTGLQSPPYKRETPLGIFVLQNKLLKMYYNKDGSHENGGFAPYASRFCNGGYIHGIPVNEPATKLIEYSPSLGTTPRSHMCVRNATSHAKFIYDWAQPLETLIIIIE